ncbi:MAG: hypothetical protein GC164_00725 [Phycisphaera sp.]|nr:hypothetical protein [Phycisphaera sp.]
MLKIRTLRWTLPITLVVVCAMTCFAGPKNVEQQVTLTAEGQQYLAEYQKMLAALQVSIKAKLPQVDPAMKAAFLKAHEDEGPRFQKQKEGSKDKPKQQRDSGIYKDFKRQRATMDRARSILDSLESSLGSDAMDQDLVKCAVLSNATPRGLAVYAQQGTAYKARLDSLLADHNLMQQILIAGGAKAGRYGKAMEIYESIRSASKEPNEGILNRLAVATAVELAAPELCQYTGIDPIRRYLAYEKWYLNKELDPAFENMTTWECRHIINDYCTEEELAWLRSMVRNYRPDTIATEYPRDKYMAINEDIPQKTPEYEEGLTNIQAILNAGGRCGPKATLGRATTRSFGIPTWGTRGKAHTAMTYWTPYGWTTALGIGWSGSYWTSDKPEAMYSTVFRLDQMARKNPQDYLKALRCGWIGDGLGQEKINGMVSGTGGFWHALALNQKRILVSKAWPNYDDDRVPWTEDAFALARDYKRRPEKDSPLTTPAIGPEDRRIDINERGVVTIPAAACITPSESTAKILFMESSLGGIQMHYRRKGNPESFVYEVTLPKAGEYQLSARVVTINRDQSLQLTLNGQDRSTDIPLPFTLGQWVDSEPVRITLVAGTNTLNFTRRVPEQYGKLVWTSSGPEFGGVTIRQFTLTPCHP